MRHSKTNVVWSQPIKIECFMLNWSWNVFFFLRVMLWIQHCLLRKGGFDHGGRRVCSFRNVLSLILGQWAAFNSLAFIDWRSHTSMHNHPFNRWVKIMKMLLLSSGTVNEAESDLWRSEAAGTKTCWTQKSQMTEPQPAETWPSP